MRITEWLGHFFPDENETIWLRSFDPKGLPPELKGFPQTIRTSRHQLATDKALQLKLKTINRTQGIYFVVNSGGNSDADINRINAIFCEIDDKPITEQHDILDYQSPWSPSIRVETKHSVHAYWLLSEPISLEAFKELQQGLIAFYHSDRSIKNLSRVMRVPMFNYVHYDNGYHYQPTTVHTYRHDLRYSLAELREGFPFSPPPKHVEKYRSLPTADSLESVKAELRARIMQLPSWSVSGKWGSANGVCHNGKGDTGLRVDLASGAVTCWSECSLEQILHAFGLEMPHKNRFEYVPKPVQKSELYKWLKEN
mgnify:CR=1 FL=1